MYCLGSLAGIMALGNDSVKTTLGTCSNTPKLLEYCSTPTRANEKLQPRSTLKHPQVV